jgi:hypothetical protein
MKRNRATTLVTALAAVLCAGEISAEVGYGGWGPRVGISDDPDQIVAGVHWDLGEFAPHVRWQPSVDFGFGEDALSLSGNLMVGYWFPTKAAVTPYAGGQVTAAYIDYDTDDKKNGDESETEIGVALVGGIETRLKSGTRFLVELQVGLGDIPDAKLLAGWTFK